MKEKKYRKKSERESRCFFLWFFYVCCQGGGMGMKYPPANNVECSIAIEL